MRKKASIVLGLAIFFIIIPLVNAQVGDQNGIPPTDAFSIFIFDGIEYIAGSYDSALEFVAGDNIILDLNNVTGVLMINSTGGAPDSIHEIGNVTNSGCAVNQILQVNSSGYFDCQDASVGGGETNTASNLSPGEGIFAQKNLVDLEFKSLDAANGIELISNGTTILINGTGSGGGSGEVNTASNLNEGYGVFASKVGDDLQFKSLLNGSGIVISQNSTNIMFNSTSTRDQIYWSVVDYRWDDNAIWLLWNGDSYGTGSFGDMPTPITKPIYLDYIEFVFNSQSITVGTYDFRVIDTTGTSPCSEHSIDLSTVSDGDVVRVELDCYIGAGEAIFIDGECTTGTPCNSNGGWFGATLEFYAVNDAMDFPGWEFQDDNLGDHTATIDLDMDLNNILNTGYYETDGTVATTGEYRMGFGDSVNWRNSLNTDDIYIETVGLDVLSFQINAENVATLSTSELNLKDNNLEIGSGRIGFDDLDTAIQQDSSDLDIRTGGSVIIDVGGTNEYAFSSSAADFNDNTLKGSLGCADEDHLEYDSGTDAWVCVVSGGGGGGGIQTMSFNAVGGSLTVAKASTHYIGFGSGDSSAENDVRIAMGDAGTASRLECEVAASGTNANTQLLVRKNNGNTSLQVNYGSGGVGLQNDNVNSFTFNQGDRLDIRVINSSSGGGSKNFDLSHCSFLVVYT